MNEVEKKAAYDRARYQVKRAEILAKNKIWRDANRSTMTRLLREWRHKNPDKARATRQRHRKNHPEYEIRHRKLGKLRHSARWNANNRLRYATDSVYRQRKTNSRLKWVSNNREKVRVISSATQKRRRAKMRLVNCRPEGIKDFLSRFYSKKFARCYYCKKVRARSGCEIDHIVPISKGGEHAIENLCVSCLNCNRRKAAKMVSELIIIDQKILSL